MDNGKIENLLQLALDSTESVREQSDNLSAGYDEADNRWEVVLRYSGDIQELEEEFDDVTQLLGGYAVLRVTQAQLMRLAQNPQVEYIEKPKALSFAVYEGKLASCINPVQRAPYNLTGRGVLVGIIDSGERVILLSVRKNIKNKIYAGIR